jgi:integrase
MKLVKNESGKYVAKITTPHGKRTIPLGVTSYLDAKKVSAGAGIKEVEIIAKTGKASKAMLAQVILGKRLRTDEAAEEFNQWLSTRSSPKHCSNISLLLSAWIDSAGIKSLPVHEIQEKHIDRWINDDSERKLSTRRLNLSCIRRFFDFCTVRNYAVHNPSAEVRIRYELLSQEQKRPEEREPFTEAEYNLLLASYDAVCMSINRDIDETERHLKIAEEKGSHTTALINRRSKLQEKLRRHRFFRLACEISWSTGLRLGDICQLEIASISKPGVLIHVTEKTNVEVRVPIKPALQSTLRKMASLSHNNYIFPEEAEGYQNIHHRSSYSKEFERFLKQKAGIENRSFHCLRHAYATNSARKEIPTAITQKRLGHAHQHTTQGYTHED